MAGLALIALFLLHEARATNPMLPLRLFRDRTFSAANAASLLFSFGTFGSIFLLAQFLQTVQHLSPLGAGLRTLPWTAMPIIVAPFVVCGVGMSLFFVPVSNAVLGTVGPAEEGVASGTNNALRELGGVIGIAVLASIFSAQGSDASGAAFVPGTRPAILVGAAIVACGAAAAGLARRRRAPSLDAVPELVTA